MLKSKLQKFSGLKYENMKENIVKATEIIPKEYYKNILEGAYNRKEKYVPKNKTCIQKTKDGDKLESSEI